MSNDEVLNQRTRLNQIVALRMDKKELEILEIGKAGAIGLGSDWL